MADAKNPARSGARSLRARGSRASLAPASGLSSRGSRGVQSPFINVTYSNQPKPDPSTRKFIRSHVMRGKNRKRTARDTATDAATDAATSSAGSWINSDHDPDIQEQQLVLLGGGHPPQAVFRRSALSMMFAHHAKNTIPLSYTLASDVNTIQFAIDIDSPTRDLVYRFFTVLEPHKYTIEEVVDFSFKGLPWIEYLLTDKAFVHALLFAASGYFNLLRNEDPGEASIRHLGLAIRSLQMNLADDDLVVADSTLFVVLQLANATDLFRNADAARMHMKGLEKMVRMRGGLLALRHCPQLQIKICRVDVTLSLKFGHKPIFFSDLISWKRYLHSSTGKDASSILFALVKTPDTRLVNVCKDILGFSQLVNLTFHTKGPKISADLFQEMILSVQYRLLHLGYEESDKQEIIRIGLLSFSASVFLEVYGLPLMFQHLAAELKRHLLALQPQETLEWSHMELWLVVIAKLTVLRWPEDHDWLAARLNQKMQQLGLYSWEAAREVLKSVVWVDIMHDEPCKKFFKECFSLSSSKS